MIKKRTYIILVCFLLNGCFFDKKVTINLPEPICLASQSACSVKTDKGEFFITFNQQTPTAETPFKIHLQYQGEHKVVKVEGFIEGVDMFMGKIPLFFNINKLIDYKEDQKIINEQSFASPAMFGSCSLEIMRWRVMFEADLLVDGIKQSQSFFIEFTSQR